VTFFSALEKLLAGPFAGQFLAFILTTAGSIAVYFLRARVQIVWTRTNQFAHRVKQRAANNAASPEPATQPAITEVLVHTASFIVQNKGRAIANDVEFVLNYNPDELSVWSQRQYIVEQNPEGRQIVRFETLAPKEVVTINVITVGREMPAALTVRCKEAIGKFIEVYPQQQMPRALIFVARIVFLLGVYFILERLTALILFALMLGGFR
jgi:hypothetical protein